jgi:hypothetical protein
MASSNPKPIPNPSPTITAKVEFNLDHKTFFVTGLLGTVLPEEGRMHFYTTHWKPEPVEGQPGRLKSTEVTQEFVTDIRMSPATFKNIMQWMKQQVDVFEQNYGEIKTQPIGTTAPVPAPTQQSSVDRRYT